MNLRFEADPVNLRSASPRIITDAARPIERFIKHYNTVLLHSAIGYVTPADHHRIGTSRFEPARTFTPSGPEPVAEQGSCR
jgi:Integrase core domain